MPTYCGIDVGLRKLFASSITVRDGVVEGVAFSPTTGIGSAVLWVAETRPDRVAVDAPPGPNRGLLGDESVLKRMGILKAPEGLNRRVAEYVLGIGGCYSTRASEEDPPGWMQTGFQVYRELAARTELPIDYGDGGGILEVHPTYGFKSLVGVERSGARLRCDPDRVLKGKNPKGCHGHRQRVGMLEALLGKHGFQFDGVIRALLEGSVDWTDSLLGSLLAYYHANAWTILAGYPGEGTIHVADPEKLADESALVRKALLGVTPGFGTCASPGAGTPGSASNPRPASRKRLACRGYYAEADGCLLRLGAEGFGTLTQQQTIDAIWGLWSSEGEVILPVDRPAFGEHWVQRSGEEGLTVLVGFGGRLVAELVVSDIRGQGKQSPMPAREVFGEDPNPWGGVESAPYWLIAGECRFLEDPDTGYDSLETWRSKRKLWVQGVPNNQSSWLAFRRPAKAKD